MNPLAHTTECGLPGVATIPYGIHMCHFYETRAELAAALVPYFVAGLRKQERCIWVTAPPLDAAAAGVALGKAGLNVEALERSGKLIIRDYASFFANVTLGPEVVELWMEEERRALAAGYSGLRVTGNTNFVSPDDWSTFMDYEALMNQACPERRIVALCSYLRERCGATEIAETVQRHSCTLDRPDEGWRILPGRV
jgi:two-component system, sensor histidine kinase PdtaS